MNQPGFRLHPLRGEYQGNWSVAVSGRWTSIWSNVTEGHVMEMGMDPVHPGEHTRESVEAIGRMSGREGA